ncbi:hypothetical protein, partial [Streptomyces boncukensis]
GIVRLLWVLGLAGLVRLLGLVEVGRGLFRLVLRGTGRGLLTVARGLLLRVSAGRLLGRAALVAVEVREGVVLRGLRRLRRTLLVLRLVRVLRLGLLGLLVLGLLGLLRVLRLVRLGLLRLIGLLRLLGLVLVGLPGVVVGLLLGVLLLLRRLRSRHQAVDAGELHRPRVVPVRQHARGALRLGRG